MKLKSLTLSQDMTGVQYDVRVCGHSVGITATLKTALEWFTESRASEKSKEILILSTTK